MSSYTFTPEHLHPLLGVELAIHERCWVCPECENRGYSYKKTWTQPKVQEGIHPAINARAGAYRTIVKVPCSTGCKKSKEKT